MRYGAWVSWSRQGRGSAGQLDTRERAGLEFLGAGSQIGRSSASWLNLERGQGPRCLRTEASCALWLGPRRCRGPGGKGKRPFWSWL